jgi:hypothetical protein
MSFVIVTVNFDNSSAAFSGPSFRVVAWANRGTEWILTSDLPSESGGSPKNSVEIVGDGGGRGGMFAGRTGHRSRAEFAARVPA